MVPAPIQAKLGPAQSQLVLMTIFCVHHLLIYKSEIMMGLFHYIAIIYHYRLSYLGSSIIIYHEIRQSLHITE